jgi:hypothetical protein
MRTRILLLALLLLTGCAPIQRPAAAAGPPVATRGEPVAGRPATEYPADVAIEWFRLAVELVRRAPGYAPPVAARTFGYMGVTLYEALVPGMPGYQSLVGQLNAMPPMPWPAAGVEYHWPTVANAALAQSARLLFPTVTDLPLRAINALEARLAAEIAGQAAPGAVEADVLEASVAHGRAVAEAVFAWSQSDGGHEGYLHTVAADYVLAAGEGLWQPSAPDYGLPLLPAWGENRPLLLPAGDACAAPPPPAYSTDPASPFYREAREVYDTVRALSKEQREIALFWADDSGTTATPPGHSLSIASQVMAVERVSLAQATELYARLGIALNDSFIVCWKTKYIYNVVRPLTYIQQVIDPNWNAPEITDPLVTPPFPEYTSGHSVEARAAAEVLTAAFGDHYRFTDVTHVDRGLAPRTFPSFYAAAAEAAVSRLYGGIHYRSAIEQGLAQGACVGRRVNALEFRVN